MTVQLYGGTYTLFAHMFPALGIDVRFAADDSVAALEALIDDTPRQFSKPLVIPQATSWISQ